jgi:hypothetical protein
MRNCEIEKRFILVYCKYSYLEREDRRKMSTMIPGGSYGFKEGVRYTQINEKYYLCLVDLIMGVCRKKTKAKATEVWASGVSMKAKQTLCGFMMCFKFVDQATEEDVIELEGAIELIALLPGKYAKACRKTFAKTLPKYFC